MKDQIEELIAGLIVLSVPVWLYVLASYIETLLP